MYPVSVYTTQNVIVQVNGPLISQSPIPALSLLFCKLLPTSTSLDSRVYKTNTNIDLNADLPLPTSVHIKPAFFDTIDRISFHRLSVMSSN